MCWELLSKDERVERRRLLTSSVYCLTQNKSTERKLFRNPLRAQTICSCQDWIFDVWITRWEVFSVVYNFWKQVWIVRLHFTFGLMSVQLTSVYLHLCAIHGSRKLDILPNNGTFTHSFFFNRCCRNKCNNQMIST